MIALPALAVAGAVGVGLLALSMAVLAARADRRARPPLEGDDWPGPFELYDVRPASLGGPDLPGRLGTPAARRDRPAEGRVTASPSTGSVQGTRD